MPLTINPFLQAIFGAGPFQGGPMSGGPVRSYDDPMSGGLIKPYDDPMSGASPVPAVPPTPRPAFPPIPQASPSPAGPLAPTPAVAGPTAPSGVGFDPVAGSPGPVGEPAAPAPAVDKPLVGPPRSLRHEDLPGFVERWRMDPYNDTMTRFLDPPVFTPAQQAQHDREWDYWWDHKNDGASSAPGGYHPRGDIFELRGDIPSLTSAYGVQVPSNAALGRKYAAREQVGIQKQAADAATAEAGSKMKTAEAHLTAAQAAQREQDYKQSEAGQAFALRLAGLQAGNAPLSDQAAKAAAGPSPLEALGPLGMAVPPKTYDEFARLYGERGGGEVELDSPMGQAIQNLYGSQIVDDRANDRPSGLRERLYGVPRLPRVFRRPGLRPLVGPPAPVRVPEVIPPVPTDYSAGFGSY